MKIRGETQAISKNIQERNIKSLSNFIYRVFNQIKIIDSSKSNEDEFIPSYLR